MCLCLYAFAFGKVVEYFDLVYLRWGGPGGGGVPDAGAAPGGGL